MSRFLRPCIECGRLARGTRCAEHQTAWNHQRELNLTPEARQARAEKKKRIYNSNYRKQARAVRQAATACHLCGGGPRPGDPFEADHLIPTQPDSPLAAAHRSCNQARGNKPLT